jgi:hypothetical protein
MKNKIALEEHFSIEKNVLSYLADNFFITTSGNFRTQALVNTMLEISADRTCSQLTTLMRAPWKRRRGSTTVLSVSPIGKRLDVRTQSSFLT